MTNPNGNSSTTFIDYVRIYEQFDIGTRYFDRFAVGSTRIGCVDGAVLRRRRAIREGSCQMRSVSWEA